MSLIPEMNEYCNTYFTHAGRVMPRYTVSHSCLFHSVASNVIQQFSAFMNGVWCVVVMNFNSSYSNLWGKPDMCQGGLIETQLFEKLLVAKHTYGLPGPLAGDAN